jgi:hypothetical protein
MWIRFYFITAIHNYPFINIFEVYIFFISIRLLTLHEGVIIVNLFIYIFSMYTNITLTSRISKKIILL